jgi:hypothetical protein
LVAILAVGIAAAQEPAATEPAPAGEEAGTRPPVAEPPALEAPAAAEPAVEESDEGETAAKPLPPEGEVDLDEVFGQLKSGRFWLMLLIALVFGGAGGVAYELLILQGNIERYHPAEPAEVKEPYPYAIAKNLIDLGIWARVIIGALAAVAALWLLTPATALGLIAGSIIAGSVGTSVFRSLQDRLLASLAQKDAEDVRNAAQLQTETVGRALEKLRTATGGGVSVQALASLSAPTDLQEAEQLLIEAQGIGHSLQRHR